MPTYQYACTNPDCGNRFELVQSFTEPSASECPVCDGPVRKVFSPVGVVFKGSGFYRTDSRASDGNGKGSSKRADAKERTGSGDSGSQTKSSSGSSESSSPTKTAVPAGKAPAPA
ncbi:MAG TPA: FmdB family zinc ribbon protein [Jatrophihabitans sp.]|nr:FmdB family zinc ribbon protein [Jatrophihabitans sp.]